MRTITLYRCDPKKNVACTKEYCQEPCQNTTRLEFARLDEDGQPIVAETMPMPDEVERRCE